MRVEGPHKDHIYEWVESQRDHELFQFREMLAWTDRKETTGSYLLTPKEKSRLLIESYETLVENHEMRGIDLLLSAMRQGHEKNRFLLAGLLLKAIQ